jgi:outer membrane receptor protein involved in Fe transport
MLTITQRLALAFCLAFTPMLWAQTVTGTISGTVIDPGGRTVPGAKINVVNEANGASRTATTVENGDFTVPSLEPGTYTTKVEATGFTTFQRTGDVLIANQRLSLGEVHLAVGAVSEIVHVTAEAAQLQTSSSENSAQLSNQQMSMIAARGRDVTDLLRLLPGVGQTASVEALGGAGGPPGTAAPNISGARAGALDFTVDGVAGNDMGTMSALSSSINMDAIGEVNVLLTNFQAEYGRNNGAIVSVVTKSGTNELHGTGYWYKRHEMFNATDFFVNRSGLAKTIYRFNTLGAAVGGPVYIPGLLTKKNKLFFFYSYDNTQSTFPAPFYEATMPTAAERLGNFSQSTLVPKDPTTGAPFPGNVIPSTRINPNTQALINLFPLPNTSLSSTAGAANYVFQGDYTIPKISNVFRIDAPVTSKDSIYVRGNDYHSDTKAWNTGAIGAPSWPWFYGHYIFTDASLATHYTRLISSAIVNEAMVSIRHSTENGPPVSWPQFDSVGTRSAVGFNAGQLYPSNNPYNVIPVISSLAGPSNAPTLSYDSRFPETGADTTIDAEEGLTYVHGAHTFKAGMYYNHGHEFEGPRGTFGGSFDFSNNGSNPLNSNNPYSNLLLGNYNTYTESSDHISMEQRTYNIDFYAQDTWKVSKNLTLDYGIRVTYYTMIWESATGYMKNTPAGAIFALSRYNIANAPRQFTPTIVNGVRMGIDTVTGQTVPAAGIGAFVPNTGNVLNGIVTAIDTSYPRGWVNQSPPRPMPRVGFAWDPFGTGKTSVRGGFGMFYQTRMDGNIGFTTTGAPPNQYNPVMYYGNVSTLLSAGSLLQPGSVGALDPKAITPLNMNVSIGIQREIGAGTVLDVKYVGTFGRHLWSEENLNLLPFGKRFLPSSADPTTGGFLPDNLLRPYPGWGTITDIMPASSSNYHGLQVSVNHRLAHGLTVALAYTYSKAMDLNDTDLAIGIPTYMTARRNYDVAGFDQTHIFSLNYTYSFPVPASLKTNKAANGILGNWAISGVTTFASGTPVAPTFTTTTGVDLNGGGDPQRMDVTCDPKLAHGDRTLTAFFNTSCFALPAKLDIGNASRNPIRGPGINNFDLTLFRNFNIFSEKRVLTFRWEAYNVLNHAQFSGVDAAARFTPAGVQSNADFGYVNASRPPRVMQASLRFRF